MNLRYSFLLDAEPTDAQLVALMQEVAIEARKRRIKADRDFKKLINKEIELAAKRSKPLLEKLS